MAVVMYDGFDGGGAVSAVLWNGNNIGNQAGRFGSYYGYGSNTTVPYRDLPSALTGGATAIGVAVSQASAGALIILTLFQSTAKTNAQCSLQINADGSVSVIRGNTVSTNVLGTSTIKPFVSPFNVYHYVEWEQTVSDTVGYFRVLVDGVEILNVNSGTVDSKASATNATIASVSLAGAAFLAAIYDDFYMTDSAATLGELKVSRLNPSADTATAQWTCSTGTNHSALVDESLYNSDTDYVSSATVGNTDLYDMENLATTPANIYGVKVTVVARKDDAVARQVRAKLKSGATTANGASNGMTSTYTPREDTWLTDPNTAAAWTAAAVNAAQIGVEVVV